MFEFACLFVFIAGEKKKRKRKNERMPSARTRNPHKAIWKVVVSPADIGATVAFLERPKISQLMRGVGSKSKFRACCPSKRSEQDAAVRKCKLVLQCAQSNDAVKQACAILLEHLATAQRTEFEFVRCVDADACTFVRGKRNQRIVEIQRFARGGTRIRYDSRRGGSVFVRTRLCQSRSRA